MEGMVKVEGTPAVSDWMPSLPWEHFLAFP